MISSDLAPAKRLLNDREASRYLGICPRTLWSLRQAGEISVVRIKRSVKFDIQDLDAFIERRKVGAK